MSFSETIYAGRTRDFAGTMKDANGTAITIAALSNVRFKVSRRGTTVLDINKTATSNGSITAFTTDTGNYTVHLDQADTSALEPGPYLVEISLVDIADGKIKHAEIGVLTILTSPDGGVG